MKIGDLVNYETGTASWGVGRVTAYEVETEMVTVQDEHDGSIWVGPEDRTSQASEKQ